MSSKYRYLILLAMLVLSMVSNSAQAQIVAVRPDVGAQNMTVVLEVLAKAKDSSYFGTDGLQPIGVSCRMLVPSDSNRVQIGPFQVSWKGRLLQIPVFIIPGASAGIAPIVIQQKNRTDTIIFRIVLPQQVPNLSGNVVLGEGANGIFSPRNTLVVENLIANSATISISSNAALEPVTILSSGKISLTNSTISVQGKGVTAGPGGGGGGHGYLGEGGAGFTGGGNSAVRPPSSNRGSDSEATVLNGGRSITGVLGGGSEPDADQGGGGGTGAPYGSSGAAGLENKNSAPGGYGGGSGGGEANQSNLAYGGGGGGFGTDGQRGGGGTGANNGLRNGGRFIIPLAGGSGGGAGNSEGTTDSAGSGGGGGGALALIAFDSVVLQRSFIHAEGDSGTSGISSNTAGGGGGSGGAILLGTNTGITVADSNLKITGGKAGAGGATQFNGGTGGLGRLRVDGGNVLINNTLTPVASSVISVQWPATLLAGSSIRISGFAGDLTNDEDSIRIFYRTNRTGWKQVDTVRSRPTGTWSKWLPRTYDSLLFVMTCIKVANPSKSFANMEPDWAMSDVGMMIFQEPKAPHLSAIDTLGFGITRVGGCKTVSLLATNDGSAPLRIDSIKIGGSEFTVSPILGFTLAPHSSDTVHVTFCPDSAAKFTGTLSLYSNDSLANPKNITLTGTGTLRNDSLVISPLNIRFERVLVGECDSVIVSLRSAGTDTVYLLASSWNNPPFHLELKSGDTVLAPGEIDSAVLRFCPIDSGSFPTSFGVDSKGDSIFATGYSVIRTLQTTADTTFNTLCQGHDAVASFTVKNIGNDTNTIVVATSSNSKIISLAPTLPLLVQPKASLAVSWRIRTPDQGVFTDTVFYHSSDSVTRTVIHYKVMGAALSIDSELSFGALCAGLRDTVALMVRNQSIDSVDFTFDTIGVGPIFKMLDKSNPIASSDSAKIQFEFVPDTARSYNTQFHITAHSGVCDSIYTIKLRGQGSTGELTAGNLIFDTTIIGSCSEDSMLVENPCGPAQTLTGLSLSRPFQYLDSNRSVTIPAGGSAWLHFRFCPDSEGVRRDTVLIGSIHTVLSGAGRDTVKPWAAFKITDATIRAGELGETSIRLDSSSLNGVHSFRVNLLFDPTVVWPDRAGPAPARITAEGVYSFDTTIDFSLGTQKLDTIWWRGLIGPRSSTTISMSVTPYTLFDVRLHPGKITITDCDNLSGHVSVSGPYIISAVRPSIVTNDASVTVELGNSGRAIGQVLDMTGRQIATVFDRDFERGSYDIPLNLQPIASGRYILVIRSMGWHESVPFIIER